MNGAVKHRLVAILLRGLLGTHAVMMSAAKRLGGRPKEVLEDGCEILLTGTFHSANWVLAHVRPLALSRGCRRVRIVTACSLPPLEKVEVIRPGATLSRLFGDVPARLLTFIAVALRSRPDALGGFHLLLNGLMASLFARLCGARSIYFCVGGPAEVQGGGVLSENRLFGKLRVPDGRIEVKLLRAVAGFDLIVTMGRGARDYFRERGIGGDIRVVAGGVEAARFRSGSGPPSWDVIFVGRLAPIKRVDLLLRALEILKGKIPGLKAVVVGDGPLRDELEGLTAALCLNDTVQFTGVQPDVAAILRDARVFVLTSKTEGLSLALMEAMMVGLPAVVSDVGDLGELVQHGVNGFLVADQTPEGFAAPIALLLGDGALRDRLGRNARAAMEGRETARVARQWDTILAGWKNGEVSGDAAGGEGGAKRVAVHRERRGAPAENEGCAESQGTPV